MAHVLRNEEAAVELGVSISTVRRMVNDGQLETVTIGKRQRITQESINKAVSGGAPADPVPEDAS